MAPQQDARVIKLKTQIQSGGLPGDLAQKLSDQIDRVERLLASQGFSLEIDSEITYLQFVLSLPWNKVSEDILDLKRASTILNQNHYGLETVKARILEYLSVLILNRKTGKSVPASILALVGLVGSGKTSLADSIAQALGRKLIRIPFGGLGSVAELKGESRRNPNATASFLLRQVAKCGFANPVILLDEVDRVSVESRSDIMGVLVEMLDPEQNWAFTDRYVDFPFDLSKALFIATANNTGNIATAVLDRLELIEMPSYSDEEKIVIGKNYLLPKVMKESGLDASILQIDESLWPTIVRPLGYDGGIRSLQRHLQGIARKVAFLVVEGKPGPYIINATNIGQFV